MYPHRIRLRTPWQAALPGGEVRRVTMPGRLADWGLGDFRAALRLVRRFGYPGRIDECERVWLTCDEIAGTAAIRLNGHSLGEGVRGAWEAEITPLLAPRNELEVVLGAEGPQGGLPGEVAMEVRRTAFLHDVRATRLPSGEVAVTGLVAGSAPRPLELYTRADGVNVDYRVVRAGEPFHLSLPLKPRGESSSPGGHAPNLVRVELVDIATVWYAVERPVEGA